MKNALRITIFTILSFTAYADTLQKAREQVNAGRSEAAVAILDVRAGVEPRNPEIFILRAQAFAQMGDYGLAVRDLNRAIKLQPDNTLAYRLRGEAWIRRGNVKKGNLDLLRAGMLAKGEK